MIKKILSLIPDSFKQDFKIKLGAPHMFWSLRNMKNNGLAATQILDIGAYTGDWTKDVLKIFPDASCLMIEANPEREKDLKNIISSLNNPKVHYEIALLSAESGQNKVFHVMDTASSAMEEHNEVNAENINLTTKSLDEVTKKHRFDNVSLIKLDVQGYELEILKGAPAVLSQAEAVLMEISLLDIHKNVPLLRDAVNFMYDYGFVTYDICSIASRRPLDKALWQTDFIFVKENSIFRQDKRYNA